MVEERYISSTKVLEYLKIEANESSDDKFAEKLMKTTINAVDNWDEYAIQPNTLKRMIKMCQTRLDNIED